MGCNSGENLLSPASNEKLSRWALVRQKKRASTTRLTHVEPVIASGAFKVLGSTVPNGPLREFEHEVFIPLMENSSENRFGCGHDGSRVGVRRRSGS